ncbi:MAG TPA: adenylate/guanylate cyclase domain-containing protein [Oxalobacteraceae bacterium]|nr:adenylate/guanylate cyclase domain-containing protein [Oxalobacteraceae bacterium]HCN87607.1 adenylate/guanylate cyclase domain-containing protein [Oxalobacteraceae bacterium]
MMSKHGARWALGLLLTLLAGAQAAAYLPTTLVDRIDLFVYDMRMRVQPAVMDPRIVILNIDERSLAEIGRWPWNRDVVAQLVDQLTAHYHVRAVGFDVVFAEPDTSSGYATLEALAHGALKDIPGFEHKVQALKSSLDYDLRLADALKGKPVVLGYFLSNEPDAVAKGLLPAPALTSADFDGRRIDATRWKGYSANLPQLQHAARGGGFFNPLPDADGVIRRVPLLAKVGDAYYESLALATTRIALGATAVRPIFPKADVNSEAFLRDYGALDAIALNTVPRALRIPVEPYLTALIQFHGQGGPNGGGFQYVSAADVIKGRLPVDTLEQKIVLVGTTVPGLKDLRTAPVRLDYPGVEMHANVISSILNHDFKQRPDTAVEFEIVQAAVVGIVLMIALSALRPVLSILFALAMAGAVIGFNFWMYQSFNLVLPMATALLLILALFVVNIAWGYLFEYRKGRAIVSLFGEYVAPELVAEMASDPARYSMEGESRELTVLFVDVRGFTTISEGLAPNILREYINLYLTAMSENIHHTRGTLDKYIGDAVMAFWGAPVALPDHAARGVATALLMQSTAQALNQDFIRRGWPQLKIGVGLNTGPMRVGDMGSKIRRAYTVMGDAVNLSSRLEGVTKIYGVGVVVGAATKLAAPDYAYRELDRVKVKGKNEPVPIFEPLALEAELDPSRRNAIERWHAALASVRAQQWDLAESEIRQLQRDFPQDGLYTLYLGRIAYYRDHPPVPDWDGVTTFETK